MPKRDGMEIIPIHFLVPGHALALETFIETANSTAAVVASLNENIFQGALEYEVLVLPPEVATFKTKIGIVVAAAGLAAWGFVESDIGQGFLRGLTGHEPAYWSERAGEFASDYLSRLIMKEAQPTGFEDADIDEQARCQVSAQIMAEATKKFLQVDATELTEVGLPPQKIREAYEARNRFYAACASDSDVKGIGFDESMNFPIRRADFVRLQVNIPHREDDPEESNWIVEIKKITVTSPNWSREDKKRYWKGRDDRGNDRLFKIDDEYFWKLVYRNQIKPDIFDRMTVQWAYQDEKGRPKNIRVVRVIEHNEKSIAGPLDQGALDAILGNYTNREESGRSDDLFSRPYDNG